MKTQRLQRACVFRNVPAAARVSIRRGDPGSLRQTRFEASTPELLPWALV